MAGGRRPAAGICVNLQKQKVASRANKKRGCGRWWRGSLPTCEIEIYGDYGRVQSATAIKLA
jgi:hypothetical protein